MLGNELTSCVRATPGTSLFNSPFLNSPIESLAGNSRSGPGMRGLEAEKNPEVEEMTDAQKTSRRSNDRHRRKQQPLNI